MGTGFEKQGVLTASPAKDRTKVLFPVVLENGKDLTKPKVIIFLNTKTRETLTPDLIDLSKQEKYQISSSESDKKWQVDPQKYIDMV